MFIDLLDQLRCPVDHDESWLVAAVERLDGRYVAQGSLGCPVCHATYEIRDFVAYFASVHPPTTPLRQMQPPTDEAVFRLAALLDLRVPGGFVGLAGAWASYAAPLALAYDVHSVILDWTGVALAGEGVSVLAVADRIPLAAGSLRGLALDAASIATSSAVRAVQVGGRIAGSAALAIPEGVRELVRDATDWVGVRGADASPLVTLGRSR